MNRKAAPSGPTVFVVDDDASVRDALSSLLRSVDLEVETFRRRGRTNAQDENVLATAAFEMLFGGIALLLVGLMLGEWPRVAFTTRSTLALAHLIVFGSIAGFTAYAYALKHLPVATVSLYAYINPLIAVVLGVLVLHEPFSARMAIAAAVVLAGIALVRRA